jgi:hypothetical protein
MKIDVVSYRGDPITDFDRVRQIDIPNLPRVGEIEWPGGENLTVFGVIHWVAPDPGSAPVQVNVR